MNTDTHFNPGGGGAAYAVRNPDQKPEPGDRVRLHDGRGRPIYGTVTDAVDVPGDERTVYLLSLDNGQTAQRYAKDLTFHGRPHAAFNTGRAR